MRIVSQMNLQEAGSVVPVRDLPNGIACVSDSAEAAAAVLTDDIKRLLAQVSHLMTLVMITDQVS